MDEISTYFSKDKSYYGEELINMYTKEDFFRDYPPEKEHFLFPWEKAYIENEVKKRTRVTEEKILAERKRVEEERQKTEKLSKVLAKMGISVEDALKM